MAHREQWKNIAELLDKVIAHVYHQVSHTITIDKLIGQVKIQEITQLFQKLHNELNHPSVKMIQVELKLRNLNIPNWRNHYREVRKDFQICRKFITAKGCKESELQKTMKDTRLA